MSAPVLSCVLVFNRELVYWQKMFSKICQGIEGLKYYMDGWLVYLEGEVDPKIFIKKLYNARSYVFIYRIDYGEKNPEGTRKPNPHHFVRCTFELNTLEESWYNKIIAALKAIQGVSFTIDTPQQMGYFSGNIELGMLMKMLAKTGIELRRMECGADNEDPPPPVKLEGPANETETQPPKDTVPPPPPPEVPITSTHLHVEYKKPRGFARLCCFLK